MEAGPPSAIYRLRKFARKHRGCAGDGGGVRGAAGGGDGDQHLAGDPRHAGRGARPAAIATRRSPRARPRRRPAAAPRPPRRRRGSRPTRPARSTASSPRTCCRRPSRSRTRPRTKVTLLEVLDRAAEKVGDRFRDQPEVEAAVRRTIAETYHGLGVVDRGERHWRSVAELERRRSGPDSAEGWVAEAQVGHAMDHLGRSSEALEVAVAGPRGPGPAPRARTPRDPRRRGPSRRGLPRSRSDRRGDPAVRGGNPAPQGEAGTTAPTPARHEQPRRRLPRGRPDRRGDPAARGGAPARQGQEGPDDPTRSPP